jgi:glycogen(starch) synthase
VHRFPFWSALQQRRVEQVASIRTDLKRIVRGFEPDLYHLFGLGTSLFFQPDVAAEIPAPTIITLHNVLPKDVASNPDSSVRRALRASDWVVSCSADLLARSREAVPQIGHRSSSILNGIRAPEEAPSDPQSDSTLLICVGRLTRQKGFDVAVAAFADIARHRPECKLLIAGDGEARGALQKQVRDLELEEKVEFAGMMPPGEIPSLLSRADIVLMPSRWEGLPVVAIQAAMQGRPIVGSDIDGLREVVLDGRTGILCPPEDPALLARHVMDLLADPARTKALGRAARTHAMAEFTLERTLDSYETLYRRISAGSMRPESCV